MGERTVLISEGMAEDGAAEGAEILGMGADNYDRLCRLVPDPFHRAEVVTGRVNRRVRVGLARALDRSIEQFLAGS